MSRPESYTKAITVPKVAFPLDYEADRQVLGVSQENLTAINSSVVLGELPVVKCNSSDKCSKNHGTGYECDGSGKPLQLFLDTSLLGRRGAATAFEQRFSDAGPNLFILIDLKAEPDAHSAEPDCAGSFYVSVNGSPFNVDSCHRFRVLLDNRTHTYYAPLCSKGEWLSSDRISGIRLDPVSVPARFSVKSITLRCWSPEL